MRDSKEIRKRGKAIFAGGLIFALLLGVLPADTAEAANTPKVKQKNITLTAGKSKTIKVSGKYIKSKKFKSTKKKIATVSKKGKVKAKKAGSCKIKITVKYRKTKKAKKISTKKLTCFVKVGKKLLRPQLDLTDAFVAQMADTSVRLVKANAQEPVQKKENVLISPESIITAMAMVVHGAGGDTQTQLRNSLYGNLSVSDFNKYMSNYNDYLTLSKKIQFHQANSIWVKSGTSVKKDFLNTNEKFYHSQTFTEPFNNKTKNKINSWVKENTNNMIPSIIDKINSRDIMYLINALAFEGRWMTQYSDYQVQKDTFTNADGTKRPVNMLSSMESLYLKDSQATGVMKLYEGGEFAFVGILPNQGISAEDYLKDMTGDSFIRLIKSQNSERVLTKIPEFSYDYETEMKPALQALGISKAFTVDADFSRMTKEDVYIENVLHKTHIELDKYGTKAAAVTAVKVAKSSAPTNQSPPKEVYLNRPFIYSIVEIKTGLPVFMGVVNTLK